MLLSNCSYKKKSVKVLVSKYLPYCLVISETKLMRNFQNSSFLLKKIWLSNRKDRKKGGGGLIEFVRKRLICKRLEAPKNVTSQIIAAEITVANKKCAIVRAYNKPRITLIFATS